MSNPLSVAPANLLFDEENPRLPDPIKGQRHALRAVAEQQAGKLLSLAKDIADHRLNPADLPIVTASPTEPGRFIVLEGNRRLAALRALENPDLLVDAVTPSILRALRKLSPAYQASPVTEVQCWQVRDREEADHWISLRHTGENAGAGLVPWGADEADRYRARSSAEEPYAQVLTFLQSRGVIDSDKRQQVPTSSLRRLLSSPDVRRALGIDVKKGRLLFTADRERVARALAYVVDDLASKSTKTADIYHADQRTEYAQNLPAHVRITPNGSTAVPPNGATDDPKPRPKPRPQRARQRAILIPSDCVLNITDNRIREIQFELRKLRFDDYPNAISVLFRVFLELSVDSYIERRGMPVAADATLASKIQRSVDDLVDSGKLPKEEAKAARTFCQANSVIAPNVQQFHAYVHSPHMFPTSNDLRANWNNLQPFVAAIWSP
jgi:hypothetical protein